MVLDVVFYITIIQQEPLAAMTGSLNYVEVRLNIILRGVSIILPTHEDSMT